MVTVCTPVKGGGYSPGHLLIGFFCHCEDMGVHIAHVLATVCIDDILSIDWQLLIRINGNKHNTLKTHKHTKQLTLPQNHDQGAELLAQI